MADEKEKASAEPFVEPARAGPSAWAVEYAAQPRPVLEPTPSGQVRVDLLTDPWSVWCWGFEPVRRTLEVRYPSIKFRSLLGGMFPKLPSIADIGFDLSRFFTVVQRTTGMPILFEGLLRDRPESTFPACVHVHAVRLLAPEREVAYLRALREAVYLDGQNISRPEVAGEVAGKVGVDPEQFAEALLSGEPEREFRERLAGLQALNLHAYPTLLVTSGTRTARVEGFQSLPALLAIVESVTGKQYVAEPVPSIVDAVPLEQRVATREVAEVLGVSLEVALEQLGQAERAGTLLRKRFPTGDVWSRA